MESIFPAKQWVVDFTVTLNKTVTESKVHYMVEIKVCFTWGESNLHGKTMICQNIIAKIVDKASSNLNCLKFGFFC